MTHDQLAKQFMWKDRENQFHLIHEMDTKHLFFTLRMIWNHYTPIQMRIEPYKKYKIGTFYSKEYISDAIKHITRELGTRNDLTPYFIKCLTKMKEYIDGNLLESKP